MKKAKLVLRLKKDYIKKATRPIIGWKRAYEPLEELDYPDRAKKLIVKLRIPVGALHIKGKWDSRVPLKSNSLWDRPGRNRDHKRRATEAVVLEITHLDGTPYKGPHAIAGRGVNFRYVVGATATPEFPFNRENVACGSGIHFFSTRKQAENY